MLSKRFAATVLTGVVALTACDKTVFADSLNDATSEKSRTRNTNAAASRSKVIERYWKILLANPREGAAFDRVYYDYVGRGEGAALIAELETLANKEVGAEKGKRLYLLGLTLTRRSERERAVEILREAETLAPELAAISTTLGKTLATQGRFQESCDALERALDKELSDEARVEVLQKLGETYVRLGANEKADAIWAEALRLYSDRADVLSQIAEIQANAGRYRQAAQLFAELEAAARERRDVESEIEFAVASGDMKIRLGEREAAIADFERAVEKLDPSHWLFKSLRDRVEYVLLQRSDYDAALDYYRRIIEKSPTDLDASARLASILGALGKYEEAENVLSDVLKRAPKNVELRRTALELALAQERHEVADACFLELDRLNANDEDAYLLWGDTVMKNDSLDAATKRRRAIEIWSRLIDEKRQNVATALLVAEKIAQNNFRAEAEKIILELVAANPNDFEVCATLAEFYFNDGEEEKAFEALNAFSKRNAKDVRAWLRRADFLSGNGYLNEAIDASRQAVNLAAENFEARLSLIELESDAGNFEIVAAEIEKTQGIAETEEEKSRLFNARMRCLEATNRVQEYLDALDVALSDKGADEEMLVDNYWNKTSCLLASGDPNGAVETAIEALERGLASPALTRKIPEIVAKSQAPERTLDLLAVAVDKDPANKANYLRGVASVRLELGMIDEAAQTARDLLAIDPGNASNYRACADILWACGLVDETAAVLRKAVALDADDKASHLKLASLLDEIGAPAEAIDVLSPIFEKSTRLEEKLTLIDALTKYYVKIDAFETLKERLNAPAKVEKTRRENAYCLSRAYMAVKAYDAARSTLENYLTFVKNRGEDDAFLLNALSNLAELQSDLEGAIRYQEALCEIDDSLPESQRLIDLYRRSDDKSRARRYLTQKILPREPLWRQLETVDVLSSLRKYDEADEILREIERKFPKNWEVAARRVSLAGWASDDKSGDAAPLLGPNALSAAIENLRSISAAPTTQATKTTELARNPETSTTIISGDAWRLGELAGRAVPTLEDSQDWRNFAAQVLTAVYREHLTLSDKNIRSVYAAISKPQAPTQGYLTFAAALFEASAWEMKKSPEKIVEIFKAETAEDAPNDVASLKKRFVFLEYATLAREKVEAFKRLPENELQEALEKTTLALAEVDSAWRVDAAPLALAKLTAEKTSERDAEKCAAALASTLEESLNRGDLTSDKSLWSLGKEISNVLTKRGFTEEARRVDELVAAAGARDYSIFLTAETTGAYRSFEAFAESIANAETRVVRQVRNRADVERARQAFGAAFAARLQVELKEAFKEDSLGTRERLTNAGERWKELAQKTAFGASTLKIFAQLNRRDLFEVETSLDEQTRKNAKSFEDNVYRLLALAFETDERLRKAFAEKEGGARNAAEPLEESLRYLGRDPASAPMLASFLVNRAVYGAERSTSLLESGALLESVVGAFFTLDVAESTQEISDKEFTRIESLRRFVAEKSEGKERYVRQVFEAEASVRALAQNALQPESSEELKAIALDSLSTDDGKTNAEDARLLVALAILAQVEGNDAEALDYLSRLPRLNFADVKAFELSILEAFAKTEFPEAIARKKEAADALLGYRLDEKEAFRFYHLLKEENRDEDAEKIRRRLMAFASDYSVVKFLLDNMLDSQKVGAQFEDDDVAFALRIFKSTSWNISDANVRAELRAKALAVLNAAGKLGETRESLERFLANAPGAVETAMRLVDVEIERGHMDSAKNFLAAFEERLPNEPNALVDYATSWAKVGEIEKAKVFLNKSFTRKPELYFSNAEKPEFWTLNDDVAFLEAQDAESLAPFAAASFRIALNAVNDENLSEKGLALIERFWNGAVSQEAKVAFQTSGLRLLATSGDARFFPYLCDWFCDAVAPNSKANEPYPDYQDVCRVVFWIDNAPETLPIIALRMLEPEKDAETLEAFLTKLQEFAELYAARPDENPARQSGNFALLISTLLRLGRVDEAARVATDARRFEAFCAQGFKNDALSICLAFEYFADAASREKYADLLLDLYERSFAENRHPVYEPFYISKIYPLGAKSVNADVQKKYVDKTFRKLREVFRIIADADFKSNRRVGGTLDTIGNFELYVQTLGNLALELGEKEKLRRILEESKVAERFDDLDGATPEWTRCLESIRDVSKRCEGFAQSK